MSDLRAARWLIDALPTMSEREALTWLEHWPYGALSKRMGELKLGLPRSGERDAAGRN